MTDTDFVLWVYICSPYAGDIDHNVAAAKKYARYAYDRGYLPVVPHLYFPQFLDDGDPQERTAALAMGKRLMDDCNEVWVFGDVISAGMQTEIDHARYWGYTIRYFTADFDEVSVDEPEIEIAIGDV